MSRRDEVRFFLAVAWLALAAGTFFSLTERGVGAAIEFAIAVVLMVAAAERARP